VHPGSIYGYTGVLKLARKVPLSSIHNLRSNGRIMPNPAIESRLTTQCFPESTGNKHGKEKGAGIMPTPCFLLTLR
jgi:hypothetical protein